MTDREGHDGRWCGGPPAVAAEAMDGWVDILRARQPWSDMPLDDVGGEFRSVFEIVLHRRDELDPDARAARLRRAARAHGAFRRRQGCQALVLSEEGTMAEEAIAIALVRSGAAPAVVTTMQDSLGPVLRAVERAAYSGYVDWGERPKA
ncbi:MAG TPA: hypothetical protein VN651_07695 [Gemmatimonadaceae bacterium]|nr:hypothetical protein [Gemmatimonadaceae bacterium]